MAVGRLLTMIYVAGGSLKIKLLQFFLLIHLLYYCLLATLLLESCYVLSAEPHRPSSPEAGR